jgi:hypothetical protein
VPPVQLPFPEGEHDGDRRGVADLAGLAPQVLDVGEDQHQITPSVQLVDLVAPNEVVVLLARPNRRVLESVADAPGGLNLDVGLQQSDEGLGVAPADGVEGESREISVGRRDAREGLASRRRTTRARSER